MLSPYIIFIGSNDLPFLCEIRPLIWRLTDKYLELPLWMAPNKFIRTSLPLPMKQDLYCYLVILALMKRIWKTIKEQMFAAIASFPTPNRIGYIELSRYPFYSVSHSLTWSPVSQTRVHLRHPWNAKNAL